MGKAEDLVHGDGWISDESDFYGNDEDMAELEQGLNSPDEAVYWFEHDKDINVIARSKRSEVLPVELYNPLEGYDNARRLNEPIADFLKRLPVGTTDITHDGWIWCANPFTNKRDEHQETATLVQKGSRALSAYQDRASQIQSSGRDGPQAAVTRQLNEERAALKGDLENLARQCGVLSGKWMLFPGPDTLVHTWRTVCDGTVRNRLGINSKVAVGDNQRGPERLICIYTKDFGDIEDVRRVLEEIIDLGLLQHNSTRGIYYKCDAWTYLGIESNNPYGLRASHYSSKDILGGGIATDQKGPASTKKQATLEGFGRKKR